MFLKKIMKWICDVPMNSCLAKRLSFLAKLCPQNTLDSEIHWV